MHIYCTIIYNITTIVHSINHHNAVLFNLCHSSVPSAIVTKNGKCIGLVRGKNISISYPLIFIPILFFNCSDAWLTRKRATFYCITCVKCMNELIGMSINLKEKTRKIISILLHIHFYSKYFFPFLNLLTFILIIFKSIDCYAIKRDSLNKCKFFYNGYEYYSKTSGCLQDVEFQPKIARDKKIVFLGCWLFF